MNKENVKKEITLDDLAEMMSAGFKKTEKQTDKKIEDLALMVAKGFNATNERMDKGFAAANERMDKGLNELKGEIKEIKADTEDIKANLNKKVDKIDHNTLTYRVEKLEKKFA